MLGTLLGATLLTIAAEFAVLLGVLRSSPGQLFATAVAVNLITVPLANQAFQHLAARGTPVALSFAAVEAAVIATETPLLAALLRRSWRAGARLSLMANLCSMVLSVFFW